ncbi:hypothetical protein GUJ93_ZPchr0002g22961 [Zizania palustris]|uniref:Uncharacterized protein n=1 Tax=Zizania palustris TaxID=103762 RepID=A0A8J5SNG0_ZIZPA|nr:hypothetical protein GUJ93_ZPchr0002g22961 [Zizania palustris]
MLRLTSMLPSMLQGSVVKSKKKSSWVGSEGQEEELMGGRWPEVEEGRQRGGDCQRTKKKLHMATSDDDSASDLVNDKVFTLSGKEQHMIMKREMME